MLYTCISMLFALSFSTANAGKVNERNWKEHPEIMEIRRLKKRVQEGQALPGWSLASKSVDWCEENGLSKKEKLTDNNGVIRKYKTEGAQGTTAFWTESIYGPKGTLRWLFVRIFQMDSEIAGEYKIFFDSTGSQVWELYKHTTEGKPTKDTPLSTDWFIKNPSTEWEAASTCPQMNGSPAAGTP